MTSQPPESQPPQIRAIRRKQVQQYLAVSAFIATQLVTGCDIAEEAEVDPMVPALFYETTEQCEATQKKTANRSSSPPHPAHRVMLPWVRLRAVILVDLGQPTKYGQWGEIMKPIKVIRRPHWQAHIRGYERVPIAPNPHLQPCPADA